jgi:hypothetical protein
VKPIPTPKNVVTHLRAMHDRLNDGWANVDDAWWTTEAATIIEKLVRQRDEADAEKATLKAERDEARMELVSRLVTYDKREYAKDRGWPDTLAALEETASEMYKGGD